MMAKIVHVETCSALNILCVAVSTEQHKVLGRRVLPLIPAWLHDRWRRCPDGPLCLPTTPHHLPGPSLHTRTDATPSRLGGNTHIDDIKQ